jgi:hybrid cluster-associated redox disulfide protein
MAKDYLVDLDRNDMVESIDVDRPKKKPVKNASGKYIDRGMLINDVVSLYPEVVPMIMDLGVHCIGCGAAMFETLEEGFMGHGMPDDEIDEVVDELNKYIAENSKE